MRRIAASLALRLVLLATPLQAGECKVAVFFEGRATGQLAELAESLVAALRQEQGLGVVEGGALAEPASLEEAAELGKRAGAEVAMLGSLKNGAYKLEARLIEVQSGVVLAAPGVAGLQGEVFDLVDSLGRRLAERLDRGGGGTHRVAILDFENRAGPEYGPFVRGLPELLAAGLGQARGLSLVERAEAWEGLARFSLAPGQALAPEEAVAVGAWLGVDWVVAGSFTEVVEVRARLVEARSGRLLAERRARGGREEIAGQVAQLGADLARSLGAFGESLRKVAVLDFENHAAAEYQGFVRGISDMLMTCLGQAEGLLVIERVQIERAMQNFALELSGPIAAEKAVEIGQWLGADAVVLGGFIRFGEVFRIDARLISARTGEVLVAQNVRGAEGEMMALVDQLGSRLLASLAEKQTEVKGGIGEVQVRFMITKTEMGERHVYRHLCKLYVDGKYLGTSPVIEEAEQWATLFAKKLRAGKHEVQVVHGFVKEGEWDGEMPEQPRVFQVVVEPGQTAAVQYSFEVGWFKDRYLYEHPWRGLPR
jgi:TolB-like protein